MSVDRPSHHEYVGNVRAWCKEKIIPLARLTLQQRNGMIIGYISSQKMWLRPARQANTTQCHAIQHVTHTHPYFKPRINKPSLFGVNKSRPPHPSSPNLRTRKPLQNAAIQDLWPHRLDEIPIAPGLLCMQPVLRAVLACDDEHDALGPRAFLLQRADLSCRIDAVADGHLQVHKHQVERSQCGRRREGGGFCGHAVSREDLDGLCAVGGGAVRDAAAFAVHFEEAEINRVVIDQKSQPWPTLLR